HDNETDIVVGADDAVNGHQNSEPNQVGIHGDFEDVELAEEAGGDGKSEQREQKEREQGSHPGLALAETGEVVKLEVLLTRSAILRNDGERADLHERVRQQIEKNCRVGRARA